METRDSGKLSLNGKIAKYIDVELEDNLEKDQRMSERNVIVEAELTQLIEKICDSIPYECKEVIEMFRNHSIIAGGCIVSLLRDEAVNDYDIFFDSKEAVNIVSTHFHTMGTYLSLSAPDYAPVHTSPNAISLKGDVQIIKKFYGNPEEVVEEFDFKHCQGYFYEGELNMYVSTELAIQNKKLLYTQSDYPINSLLRAFKFVKDGWEFSKEAQIAIGLDIAKLDIINHDIFCEQLQGVSTAFLESVSNEIDTDLKKGMSMLIQGIDEDSARVL